MLAWELGYVGPILAWHVESPGFYLQACTNLRSYYLIPVISVLGGGSQWARSSRTSQLHRELKAGISYMRPSLKKEKIHAHPLEVMRFCYLCENGPEFEIIFPHFHQGKQTGGNSDIWINANDVILRRRRKLTTGSRTPNSGRANLPGPAVWRAQRTVCSGSW